MQWLKAARNEHLAHGVRTCPLQLIMSSRDTVLAANPEIKALLGRLHSEHQKQETSFSRKWYNLKYMIYVVGHLQSREAWNEYSDRSRSPICHLESAYEVILTCRMMSIDIVKTNTCRTAKKNASSCTDSGVSQRQE